MKQRLLVAIAFMLVLGIACPPAAEARVFVGVGVGCCGGYYPGYYGYPYPYPAYYYPYAVAPPPVVYAVPPVSPVVYPAPPPVVMAPAPVAAIAPSAPVVTANQTSPTFIDSAGRTCRHFQSTSGGTAYGTACLQPDGSWRAVQ